MRKIISAILCICIVLTLFSGITVSAQSVNEALYQRVSLAAREFNQNIDISDLSIPENKHEILSDVMERITNNPEFFYVSNGFSYFTNSMKINFSYSKTEAAKMKSEFDAIANEMVADLKESNLSDAYKALLIHDRLAVWCEYDYENYKKGIENIPTESYNLYGALVKRIAVCEGYSKAYMYMLSLVGIDSEVCTSKQLRHMWNKVEIDGKWYYVDVTHDDPVDDIVGRVTHKNFLVSSAELHNGGSHNANDYDMSLDSTEYDDYYWETSDTEFQYIGGEIYYFDNQKGELKRLSDNHIIDTVSDRWSAGESMAWSGNYTRISSCDENIYYSGKDAIYIYHTKTGLHHEVKDLPHLPEHLEIYGLLYEKDKTGKKFVFEYRDCPAQSKLTGGQVVPAEVSEKQFYFDITEHKFSGLVSGDDDKWHYVVNGEACLETGIINIGETRFYVVDGIRHSGVALVTDSDGKEYYFENGVLTAETGLFKVGENYYYIVDGVRQYDTCFIRYNGTTVYYIENGIRQYKTGFQKYGSYYYYLQNGIRQNYTGFIKSGSKTYYVSKGVRSTTTGFVKSGSKYYYIYKGYKKSTTGFIKSGSKTYYVSKGVRSTKTGFVKSGSKYYYIYKGYKKNTTGFIKSGSKTYYVSKGIRSTKTALVKVGKKSYYIKKGIKQTKTGIVKIGSKKYYLKKGVLQVKTGKVKIGKKTYKLKKGIVQ